MMKSDNNDAIADWDNRFAGSAITTPIVLVQRCKLVECMNLFADYIGDNDMGLCCEASTRRGKVDEKSNYPAKLSPATTTPTVVHPCPPRSQLSPPNTTPTRSTRFPHPCPRSQLSSAPSIVNGTQSSSHLSKSKSKRHSPGPRLRRLPIRDMKPMASEKRGGNHCDFFRNWDQFESSCDLLRRKEAGEAAVMARSGALVEHAYIGGGSDPGGHDDLKHMNTRMNSPTTNIETACGSMKSTSSGWCLPEASGGVHRMASDGNSLKKKTTPPYIQKSFPRKGNTTHQKQDYQKRGPISRTHMFDANHDDKYASSRSKKVVGEEKVGPSPKKPRAPSIPHDDSWATLSPLTKLLAHEDSDEHSSEWCRIDEDVEMEQRKRIQRARERKKRRLGNYYYHGNKSTCESLDELIPPETPHALAMSTGTAYISSTSFLDNPTKNVGHQNPLSLPLPLSSKSSSFSYQNCPTHALKKSVTVHGRHTQETFAHGSTSEQPSTTASSFSSRLNVSSARNGIWTDGTKEHPTSSAPSSCQTTAMEEVTHRSKGENTSNILRTAARIAVSSATPMGGDAQKQHARYYTTRGTGVLVDGSQSGVDETSYGGEHERKSRQEEVGSREHAAKDCDGFVTGGVLGKREGGGRPRRGLRAAAAAAWRVLGGAHAPCHPPPNEGTKSGAHGGGTSTTAAHGRGAAPITTNSDQKVKTKMKKTTEGEAGEGRRCMLGRGYGCGLTRTRWDKEEKKKHFVAAAVSSNRSTSLLEPQLEEKKVELYGAQSASAPPTRGFACTERNDEMHHPDYASSRVPKERRRDLFTSSTFTMTPLDSSHHAPNPSTPRATVPHRKLRDTLKTTTSAPTSTSTTPSSPTTSITRAAPTTTTTTTRIGDALLRNKRLAGRSSSLLFQPTQAQPQWFNLDKRFKSEEEAYVKVMGMLNSGAEIGSVTH